MFGIDFSKFPDVFSRIFLPAIGETLYMSIVSTLLAFAIGLIPAVFAHTFRQRWSKAKQTALFCP